MKYNNYMSENDFNNNLLWLFLKASFRAKKGFVRLAEEEDLTVVQLYTLCLMEPGSPLPMNVIANMLICDASNVTGIIDRLFSRHYIERQEKPTDRRVKMIALTSEGEKLRNQIIEKITVYKSESFDRLNQKQKNDLRDILKEILS